MGSKRKPGGSGEAPARAFDEMRGYAEGLAKADLVKALAAPAPNSHAWVPMGPSLRESPGRWEYLRRVLTAPDWATADGPDGTPDLTPSAADALGANGWELVAAVPGERKLVEKSWLPSLVCLFKRRVVDVGPSDGGAGVLRPGVPVPAQAEGGAGDGEAVPEPAVRGA